MMPTERIGRYRVERLLGVGSFATVWLGHDEALDARVAIKVLAENWSHDLRVRERFLEEARLLWRLEDERLLRVHGFDELPDGRPYAVLAWADGGSLRDRLGADPPEVEWCGWLLQEIAAGVQVLHEAQIVHRDLTPGNVLFRSRPGVGEQVVVADLGLAKELAAASGLTARAGTPGYMAPEQDDPLATVDCRTDVYGLGRLGVTLLTEPDADAQTGWRLRAGVPAATAAVLQCATAIDPDDRYADAAGFAAALTTATDDGGAAAVPPPPPPADAGGVRRGRRSAVVATCLLSAVATVALVAGLLWWHSSEPAVATSSDGQIRVELPAGWRGAGTGWAGRTDAAGQIEPALIISPDPGGWATDDDVPGAFVGLSPTLADETTPEQYVATRRHAHCDAPETTRIRAGDHTWTVASFAGCRTGKGRIVEAATTTSGGSLLYAQIAPPSTDAADLVDVLLAGIAVPGR